ncbi:lactonase family protein (plasmid) [Roseomonas gilardii subsp. gilardii]|uniref:lactonase family protein n=1 Tax=Roseomonas gilardii TaxID=257708 RepID=UPI001FFA355E|nr:lactonase family protein [Roseomonas gilardii]UPG74821.1 lactonase family protein [Roseomonas gilardii subsp. gilardii]
MPSTSKSFHAYVGCRTTRERNARGDGISLYRVDAETGAWTHEQLVGDLLNPSFLCFDRQGRFLYTVHGDSTEVSAFRIDPGNGRLSLINRQSTEGKNPVHLAVDPTNRFLVIANHITSTLALLPIDPEEGAIGPVRDLVTLTGKIGPHRVEQPFAKPHQVEFDRQGRFILVPDKGLDRVFTFRLDADAGKLVASEQGSVPARETSGPRHVVLHPRAGFAYVVNELDSTVTAYRYSSETGALEPVQVVSSLPDTFTGNSRAAEIAISADGRFVYASNRGSDTIAAFAVDEGTGRLTPVQWAPSGGRTPRFFTLSPDGRFLFVANEDDDTIQRFRIDARTGQLTADGLAARTGSPVCIVFRPAT